MRQHTLNTSFAMNNAQGPSLAASLKSMDRAFLTCLLNPPISGTHIS